MKPSPRRIVIERQLAISVYEEEDLPTNVNEDCIEDKYYNGDVSKCFNSIKIHIYLQSLPRICGLVHGQSLVCGCQRILLTA